MKVAIVHDDLVQWGGAERVLKEICAIFPDAPVYTSVYDSSNKLLDQNFKGRKIITSFMQNIPGWRMFYKALLPLYPIAFEQYDFSEYDLVLSQTTRFAKSVITKPGTKHICYMHTPPRFLWNFSKEKTPAALKPYFNFLRYYDRISANRVDQFLAGSYNARDRIKNVYGQNSKVLQPFVDTGKFYESDSFDGGYYLVIARLNKYKNVDLAVKAFNKLGLNLKVVGKGPQLEYLKGIANKNIDFAESVSENLLINLLQGCRALLVMAEEDFGLTPIEAQAAGKPVVAYKKGGALETVVEGKTGVFFENLSVADVIKAVENLEKTRIDPKDCRKQAAKFSRDVFRKRMMELVKE